MRSLFLFLLLLAVCSYSFGQKSQTLLRLNYGLSLSAGQSDIAGELSLIRQLALKKRTGLVLGLGYTSNNFATDLTAGCPPERITPCEPGTTSVKAYENRIVGIVGLYHKLDRFMISAQLQPVYRINNRIDFYFPYILPGSSPPTNIFSGANYGLPINPLPGVADVQNFIVNDERLKMQLALEANYRLNARIFVGLSYRYEGLVNGITEVTATGGWSPDYVAFSGRRELHILMANLSYAF